MQLKLIFWAILVAEGVRRGRTRTPVDYNEGWQFPRKYYSSIFNYPRCRSGTRQSPINLSDTGAIEGRYSSLILRNFDVPRNFNIKIDFELEREEALVKIKQMPAYMYVSGGGLIAEHHVMAVFFRFPAEHTIYGTRYPLEVQFLLNFYFPGNSTRNYALLSVFFNVSQYDTNDAMWDTFFASEYPPFKAPYWDPPQGSRFPYFHHQLEYYQRPIYGWTLADLLPEDLTSFYRYNGSLYLEDCIQDVVWTILTTTLSISQKQLDRFRTQIPAGHTIKKLKFNNRRQSPLNGREVMYNTFRNDDDNPCGASWLTGSPTLLATIMFMQLMWF